MISRQKRGFTLVELIVSVAALSLICALVLRLFLLSGEINKKNENKQHALTTAADILENIKAADSFKDIFENDLFTNTVSESNDIRFVLHVNHENGLIFEILLERDHEISSENGDYYVVDIKVIEKDEAIFELSGGKYFAK